MSGARPGTRTCKYCGASLSGAARFCGCCGRATDTQRRQIKRRISRGIAATRRAALAMAVVYGGVLFSIGAGWWLFGEASGVAYYTTAHILYVATGGGALWLLGRGALRASLPLRCDIRWVLLGVPAGLAAVGVSLVYVHLLLWVMGGSAEPVEETGRALVIATVVLAPLFEEWLCRGVLWSAVRRIGGDRLAIVLTAVLFAMMHGLGGYVLALPHRFLGGLLFGWLRARSSSLWPSITAHFVWNLVAVLSG